MNKILLITNIYPLQTPENQGTPVCHFFARDWVKLGYIVVVLHVQAVYPAPFYWAAKLFQKFIAAKTGAVIYTRRESQAVKYTQEDVTIYRFPCFKWFPHRSFTRLSLENLKTYFEKQLEGSGFNPDYICAHFPNPMVELLTYFGQKYNAKTCYVSHGDEEILRKIYPDYYVLLSKIDVFGFRSETIKRKFEAMFGNKFRSFICYSGIPESYISENEHSFSNDNHFCYLGSLFELKRVQDTLIALHIAFPNNDFIFDVIGDGQQRSFLEKKSIDLGISNCVLFHGQLSRNEAQEILNQADYFIMISAHEAFGLVYLEAMGKGLITLGTKGQGIDGVIRDGENGYLCESNNPERLAEIITFITKMPIEEKNRISKAAKKTVENLTDIRTAQHYIDSVKYL